MERQRGGEAERGAGGGGGGVGGERGGVAPEALPYSVSCGKPGWVAQVGWHSPTSGCLEWLRSSLSLLQYASTAGAGAHPVDGGPRAVASHPMLTDGRQLCVGPQ